MKRPNKRYRPARHSSASWCTIAPHAAAPARELRSPAAAPLSSRRTGSRRARPRAACAMISCPVALRSCRAVDAARRATEVLLVAPARGSPAYVYRVCAAAHAPSNKRRCRFPGRRRPDPTSPSACTRSCIGASAATDLQSQLTGVARSRMKSVFLGCSTRIVGFIDNEGRTSMQ